MEHNALTARSLMRISGRAPLHIGASDLSASLNKRGSPYRETQYVFARPPTDQEIGS